MSKSKIFIGMAISFAIGVWLASWLILPRQYALIALAVAAIAFALTYDLQNNTAAIGALFLFCLILGALRLQASFHTNEFQQLFDTKQKLEGYIVEDADIRQANQFLTFQPNGYSQRILISAPLSETFAYGDWAVVEGKIIQPQNFSEFDYQKYLERYNIYAAANYPKILVLKSNRLNPLVKWLFDVKWNFTARVDILLPEPQSSLLMGILIGARKTLPQSIVDNFNATGTSHIIAVSGYNITIIISSLGFLAWYLGRRWGFWVTLFIIIGFVILSGGTASVVRAAIMGSLVLLAARLGRQYAVAPALFFTALLMLIQNPKILYWDASFQLSFLATLGIICFQPLLEKLTQHWPNPFNFKIILFTTFSAMAATLPIILFTFGRLSVIAPLANILILPVVPPTMFLGFFVAVPFLGPGFAFAAGLFLQYILRVTAMLAAIPFGNFSVKISGVIFAALCALVFLSYIYLRRIALAQVPVDEPDKIW